MRTKKLQRLDELKKSLKRILDSSNRPAGHYSNVVKTILPHHIGLEIGMETVILLKVRGAIYSEFKINPTINSLQNWLVVSRMVKPLLNELTFFEKLKVIRKRNYLSKDICNALEKVNQHRNDLAHDRVYMSNSNYDIRTDEGLENILDLYENIKIAHEGIDRYWVTWMRNNRLRPATKPRK